MVRFLKSILPDAIFYDFFGENVFRADMCNADVKLGDLLIHEGSAKDAQKFAAKVFHADKTYFVLNGTSAANKVVTNALLTRGDLVLFDRNNHKSNHHGALIQAGATPVYLEASRNPFGSLAVLMRTVLMKSICASKFATLRQKKPTCRARIAWRLFSWEPMTALSITPVR
ncbi:Ornithine decarboxylase [Escherichia coli]|nr:Ornithine decarboxylase [Escherichia coli]